MNIPEIGERILLWPQEDECLQEQPVLEAYPVPHSRGAIIVCPGGGYRSLAAHEGSPVARMLNSFGISAYVLLYSVSPHRYDAPLKQAQRAIRMVKAAGYSKVGILGFSAGGHLCCSAATLFDDGDPENADEIERLSSRPDVFIPCYPVVTMSKDYQHEGSRLHLLQDRAQDDSLCRRFSAEENITENTPPAFIWHTSQDGVSVKNSLYLAAALAEKKIPFELHVYPNGRHGLSLAAEHPVVAGWGRECGRWLLEHGFGG